MQKQSKQEQIREILNKYYIYETREQVEQGYSVNSRLEQELSDLITQTEQQKTQEIVEMIEKTKSFGWCQSGNDPSNHTQWINKNYLLTNLKDK